ncbi:hypothetical protein FRX31_004772 [Thalictrum thalictroides]|uniref:Uncharacterized protein n=1 Tax=Thalictrum thalictroides TaxID=46969 RepID=A0A7J6XB19_THATH|nr:hypothetical protein FRX31_004772 [Thalictrum thalictroides]
MFVAKVGGVLGAAEADVVANVSRSESKRLRLEGIDDERALESSRMPLERGRHLTNANSGAGDLNFVGRVVAGSILPADSDKFCKTELVVLQDDLNFATYNVRL